MKVFYSIQSIRHFRNSLAAAMILLASTLTSSADTREIDDFSKPEATASGTPRLVIDDASIGGQSTAALACENGILKVSGHISPARGQPGFISIVLPLEASGQPQDLTGFSGIEIRIRVLKGTFSLIAASSDIQNFDYHSAAVSRSREFQTVRIPFNEMRRVWSEQTSLDTATITSINLVASAMQAMPFLYEVDFIALY